MADITSRPEYAREILSLAADIEAAPDIGAVAMLLRVAVGALGAERGAFVSFLRLESSFANCRIVAACDPAWAEQLINRQSALYDPWLAYAARDTRVTLAENLPHSTPTHEDAMERAREHGFVSTLLAPAHGGRGFSRIGLLCLGSSRPGFFAGAGSRQVRLMARLVATEFQEWMVERRRAEVRNRACFTDADRTLMQHLNEGLTSKQIARRLALTSRAVDSRFNRIVRRLSAETRKDALAEAIDCGLITDT